ncbi:MarR family winged helix-turn-helix transcriptional regulator [Methanosphaera sp. WGK6]|uniref:MarR family winged helix-turn-helix transcriptional regulator n=1 Tax=Methanosphaera sp. WGK6 TaxID=1561964 RepID=UPI00084C63CE|nr:MarR family transcriptional regulator [Methanosphaera sp. WGK6]
MLNNKLYYKIQFINELFDKKIKMCTKQSSMNYISRGQGRVIAMLKLKDGISTSDLSKILGIRVSSLNEILNKLEKKNFITKESSCEDKRILLIKLTQKGQEYEFKQLDESVFDCLECNEKDELDSYLDKIIIELNKNIRSSNPEKYDKLIREREELFKKHFNSKQDYEWYKLLYTS